MTREDLIKLYQSNRWSNVTVGAETLGELLAEISRAEARVVELEAEVEKVRGRYQRHCDIPLACHEVLERENELRGE